MKKIISLFLLTFGFSVLSGQYLQPEPGMVFVEDEVPRVDLSLSQEDIDAILDNVESNEEYPATFIFTSSESKDTLYEVGVRLRGNTSRYSAKKSIKVSFNTFKPGRKFNGLEKMNLNGEHNDPSILRAKLGWNLCAQLNLPSARSNHIALYVNNEYLGLYLNVEHIDEEFIQKRFDGRYGNLYKCLYPADLAYKGENPDVYKEEIFGRRNYGLKTNTQTDDYSDLAHFIDVLNNYTGDEFQCELERIFDVDSYLKNIVVDVLTSNWDGPIVNKNNFYLYTDSNTGIITYLPYDLDNTFGIDWFNVDWTQTQIYDWSFEANEARPIYDGIMSIKEYRDRYSYYFREAIDLHFNLVELFPYLEEKKNLIRSFRENDPLAGQDYGWTFNDFLRSFDEPLGAHVKNGLVDYITQRVDSAEEQLELGNTFPFSKYQTKVMANQVNFQIQSADDEGLESIQIHYSENGGTWESQILGFNEQGETSFNYPYTDNGILNFYFEVTDNSGQTRNFPLCQNAEVQLGYLEVPALVINEIMASNSTSVSDEAGEYEDWIELYYSGSAPLSLERFYLTDDQDNPIKWRLPKAWIYPNDYYIIWLDGDTGQGEHHANFKLSKSGEFLGLFDGIENNRAVVDTLSFPTQETDFSFARSPNGTGDFVITEGVTFDYNNDEYSSTQELAPERIKVYPVPAKNTIHLGDGVQFYDVKCYSSMGAYLFEAKHSNTLDLNKLKSGSYFLQFSNGEVSRFHVIK